MGADLSFSIRKIWRERGRNVPLWRNYVCKMLKPEIGININKAANLLVYHSHTRHSPLQGRRSQPERWCAWRDTQQAKLYSEKSEDYAQRAAGETEAAGG